MFLKDALLRCSKLETEIAAVFAGLAAAAGDTSPRGSLDGTARRARTRSALLHSLAELTSDLDDGGPFLVQISPQLAAVKRGLDAVKARAAAGENGLLELLDATPRNELYASLLDVAEPLVRRTMRLVENERRNSRRSGSERSAKGRTACTVAAS